MSGFYGPTSRATSGRRLRVTLGNLQPIPNDIDTKINFDTETWDAKDEFTNGTYTCKEEGYHFITCNLVLLTNQQVFLIALSIKHNSSFANSQYTESITLYPLSSIRTTDTLHLEVGDTIELWTHQESGDYSYAIGIPNQPTITTMSINKV